MKAAAAILLSLSTLFQAVALATAPGAEPRVDPRVDPGASHTEVIGPFSGHDAPLHPDNLQPEPRAAEEWAEEYGFFYSANIIEQWTRADGNGVDIIWNASTWDPYRVILLRTRINP